MRPVVDGNGIREGIPGVHFGCKCGQDQLVEDVVHQPGRQKGAPHFQESDHRIRISRFPRTVMQTKQNVNGGVFVMNESRTKTTKVQCKKW